MARTDPLEGVDADGMIVTGARRDRIPAAFTALIDSAIERVAAIDGSCSLLVYGSVATGQAQPGVSDVDLVLIGPDRPVARKLGEALTAQYQSLCRGVEVGAAQLSDYEGDGDEAYGNRVFLRHYCVHLAGAPVGQDFPRFPADRRAARGFNGDIALRAAQWKRDVDTAPDPALLARRVGRKTLFAVAGLVSMHDAGWTTNRAGAARRWAVVRPDLADSLGTLLAWGDGTASASRPDIQRMLDGAVAQVVDEFTRLIGLWEAAKQ